MKKKYLAIFTAVLLMVWLAVVASADPGAPALDCNALSNSALAEPEGYAEQCLGQVNPMPASAGALDPTDIAYVFEMRNRDEIVTHALNNFPTQTQVTAGATAAYYGWDFDAAATTLYAHDTTSGQLGTINTSTGAFTPIGSLVLPNAENLTGLAIDPITNEAFALGSGTGGGNLYSVNLTTAAFTLIGSTGANILIDFSINCAGEMYGHDITADTIVTINRNTAAVTTIGSTGLAANFAQGMDFDNADGTLYVYGYTGGGTNTYGSVNLATGAVTPLSVDTPLGEYEGATQTTCAAPPAPAIVMTKTVGTDPMSCAATDTVSIPYGGTAYYCYSVENTGNITLTHHTVMDDALGTVLGPDAPYDLAPGATFAFTASHSVLTQSVTAGATWTASIVGTGVVATATGSTTVNVGSPTDVALSNMAGQATGSVMLVALIALTAILVGAVLVVRRQWHI